MARHGGRYVISNGQSVRVEGPGMTEDEIAAGKKLKEARDKALKDAQDDAGKAQAEEAQQ